MMFWCSLWWFVVSLVTARLDVVQNVSDELLGLDCQVEVYRRSYWLVGLEIEHFKVCSLS